MNDLVQRLRSLADCDARAGEPLGKCMREAADHIEALERVLSNLVSANEAVQLVLCDGPEVPGFEYTELSRAQMAVVEAEKAAKLTLT